MRKRVLKRTCLLIGCQVLLKLNTQHLVLFADLGQRVLQLNDFSPQLFLKGQLIALNRRQR